MFSLEMITLSKPLPISFQNLLETEWPEDVFIEGGILSRGDSLLVGAESKAGKSTLLSLFIKEAISGGDFLGFKFTKPLKVLYMQAELREYRLKLRLMPTYSPISKETLLTSEVWNTRGLILIDKDIELIRRELGRIRPDLLFLDPIVNFHTYEENDATEMSKLFRILDQIKVDFKLALILAHHFRKKERQGKQESLMEMIRGSSVLRGWVDTTIAIEGRTKSEYRRLEFDTRNSDEPIRRLIKYNSKTKTFDWHDPLNAIYDMLAQKMNGSPMPTTQAIQLILTECGDLVGRNRTKAFELKDLLVSTGQLIATEDGKSTLLSIPS